MIFPRLLCCLLSWPGLIDFADVQLSDPLCDFGHVVASYAKEVVATPDDAVAACPAVDHALLGWHLHTLVRVHVWLAASLLGRTPVFVLAVVAMLPCCCCPLLLRCSLMALSSTSQWIVQLTGEDAVATVATIDAAVRVYACWYSLWLSYDTDDAGSFTEESARFQQLMRRMIHAPLVTTASLAAAGYVPA